MVDVVEGQRAAGSEKRAPLTTSSLPPLLLTTCFIIFSKIASAHHTMIHSAD